MDSRKPLKLLMFPWLAHGHIAPYLYLAKKLTLSYNFIIYLCSTPVNLASIKTKLTETESSSIHFVELHLPSSPELPPHYHTTNGLPLHLNTKLQEAFHMSQPNFEEILKTLKPDLLIRDVLQPWAGALASKYGIPFFVYSITSMISAVYFMHLMLKPGIEFPFRGFNLSEFEISMLYKLLEAVKRIPENPSHDHKVDEVALLYNTSRELEGMYIDYYPELANSKTTVLPVGALVQEHDDKDQEADDDDTKDIMDWLAKKEEGSCIYASFGSEYYLSKEEILEIAYGLETSGANFIWVVRSAKGEEAVNIRDILPKGYFEKVSEKGRIIEKWAPQVRILKHKSTGAFLTHCGWNAALESIDLGLPIVAIPMHLEQPVTAKSLSVLGIAEEVSRDEGGKFKRDEIARAVREVMAGERGKNLRTRVEEIRGKIRAAREGEIEAFVKKAVQVCSQKSGDDAGIPNN